MAAVAAVDAAAPTSSKGGRQIPIVCPGHTRPLAELQFCRYAFLDTVLILARRGVND